MPEPYTPLTVRLPREIKQRADALAARRYTTISTIMRQALADYLDRHPDQKNDMSQ